MKVYITEIANLKIYKQVWENTIQSDWHDSSFFTQSFKETTECGLHVNQDESYAIQPSQFPNDDSVDALESNNYHFKPVIENIQEDVDDEFSSFPRTEMRSNYLNEHFPSAQQLENESAMRPVYSYDDIRQPSTWKNSMHSHAISEDYFENTNITEVF